LSDFSHDGFAFLYSPSLEGSCYGIIPIRTLDGLNNVFSEDFNDLLDLGFVRGKSHCLVNNADTILVKKKL